MKFKFNPAIAVEVDNLGKAKKYYIEVLGMDFLSEKSTEAKLSAHAQLSRLEKVKSIESI